MRHVPKRDMGRLYVRAEALTYRGPASTGYLYVRAEALTYTGYL